ncbi:MAG: hypothetical protein JRI23_30240, partial [Deltaproteobacteria bacterium]|nr:hypothetical protein [Deltaproteobacteria bacterium]MBW2536454.1 hypothetical protein [Deltaproteobacteria bacterium]
MESGPATNTRTLDVTLRDAIQRLSRAKPTDAIRKLLAEARHYESVLAAWTSVPPPPQQQDAIIDEVFDLVRRTMTVPMEERERSEEDDGPEIVIGDAMTEAEARRSDPTAGD